jgi:endoribonuclease LACTB2
MKISSKPALFSPLKYDIICIVHVAPRVPPNVTKATAPTIVNVGYRSTNYWVVSVGKSRLLVDLGWPGTMGLMQANLRRMGIPLSEMRYALATHYHVDHAGLAEELKNAGVPLLVIDVQLPAIPLLKRSTKPADHFVDITMTGNVVISTEDSRDVLRSIGIEGEIVHTPGHSEDSVSLLLDDGSVFTGDLTPPGLVTEEQASLVTESWKRLRDRGARHIYPGHGSPHALEVT